MVEVRLSSVPQFCSRRAADAVGKGTLPKDFALPGALSWDDAEYAPYCHMWQRQHSHPAAADRCKTPVTQQSLPLKEDLVFCHLSGALSVMLSARLPFGSAA